MARYDIDFCVVLIVASVPLCLRVLPDEWLRSDALFDDADSKMRMRSASKDRINESCHTSS